MITVKQIPKPDSYEETLVTAQIIDGTFIEVSWIAKNTTESCVFDPQMWSMVEIFASVIERATPYCHNDTSGIFNKFYDELVVVFKQTQEDAKVIKSFDSFSRFDII